MTIERMQTYEPIIPTTDQYGMVAIRQIRRLWKLHPRLTYLWRW